MKTQRENNIDRLEGKLDTLRSHKNLASLSGSYYGKSISDLSQEIDAIEIQIHELKNRHNCG